MTHTILRLPQVISEVGLSRSAIYQRMTEESFPKSINLGGRAVGWLASEIQIWIKDRLAASRMER
jgi:prophage regulatory protein